MTASIQPEERHIWNAERPFVVAVLRSGLGLLSARDAVSFFLDAGVVLSDTLLLDFPPLFTRLKHELSIIPEDIAARLIADMPAGRINGSPVIAFNFGDELSCKRLFAALLAHYKATAGTNDPLIAAMALHHTLLPNIKDRSVDVTDNSSEIRLGIARYFRNKLDCGIHTENFAAALARPDVVAGITSCLAMHAPEVMASTPHNDPSTTQ